MTRFALFAAVLIAAACSPAPAPEPEAPPATPEAAAPVTLADLQNYRDWTNGDASAHAAAFSADAKRVISPMSRAQTIDAFAAAGYECMYGEAHADYPDPAQVCKREFATRACQMTWEIMTTADKGMTTDVTTEFVRDCVGTDMDWPHAIESPIDDQLAPPNLPATPSTPPT